MGRTAGIRVGRGSHLTLTLLALLLSACQDVQLISVSTNGEYGNGFSAAPSISLDGNYVAFMSRATNLVDGYTLNANVHQCYVRDVQNETTEIVSVSDAGVVADNDCFSPRISQHGRYVVFSSDSDKLDPDAVGLTPVHTSMIYVRDRQAGTTRVISLPETTAWVENVEPAIVPAGGSVYYYNFRTATSFGDPDFGRRIYHFQPSTGQTEEFRAGTLKAVDARRPAAGRIGAWLAFESREGLSVTHRDGSIFPVVPDATTLKVYLYHYPTNRRYLASNRYWHCYTSCDYPRWWQNPGGDSGRPAISPLGTTVAFETEANLVDPGSDDRNGVKDIYLYRFNRWAISEDELVGTPYIRRVSVSSEGEEADGESFSPSMGGAHVAFASRATNLVSDDTDPRSDIFRHDLATGETIRISTHATYDLPTAESIAPSISEDGSRIAFMTSGGHTFGESFGQALHGQIYLWR